MQPGETITPLGDQPQPPVQDVPAPAAPSPVQAPPSPAPSVENPPVGPNPLSEQDELPAFQAREPLSWTASEFVEHQKPQGWYALLAVGAVVVAALLYFLVHDIITVVVVVLAVAMFGVVGARKPRSMSYTLGQAGLQIGERSFPYASFKSFSVIEEGAMDSIQLMPLKRLMPPISLYFPPEQEQEIIDTLADYLPHEDRNHDPIDRLMKRLHF